MSYTAWSLCYSLLSSVTFLFCSREFPSCSMPYRERSQLFHVTMNTLFIFFRQIKHQHTRDTIHLIFQVCRMLWLANKCSRLKCCACQLSISFAKLIKTKKSCDCSWKAPNKSVICAGFVAREVRISISPLCSRNLNF